MKTEVINQNDVPIALLLSEEVLIDSVQAALDLVATVRFETDCDRMAINKDAIAEDFFRLSTGLAGGVLQKFVTYQMKLAIIGDFSHYTSKPLRDFMGESNRGNSIFFVTSAEEALAKLSSVR